MRRRAYLLRLSILAALLLIVGSMLAVSGFSLWRLHAEAMSSGFEISEMYTRGFEDVLTQSLRMTTLITANNFENERPRSDPQHLAAVFETTLRRAPILRSLSIIDDQGRIVASSNLANIGLTVPTGNYLPPSSSEPDVLRIGTPWVGRDFFGGRPVSDGRPAVAEDMGFVPLTQRLVTKEGTINLLIALNPDYFVNHFSQKLELSEGTVEVLRYDGVRLLSTDPERRPGVIWRDAVHALNFAEQEFGRFEGEDVGRPALTTFRTSRLYPIVVVTHFERTYALRNWTSASITLLSVVPPILLVLTLMSVAYYRRHLLANAQREEAARVKAINATVFDSSNEATLITAPDGGIVSVNPAFVRVTGFADDEVIGRPLFELLTPEGAEMLRDAQPPKSRRTRRPRRRRRSRTRSSCAARMAR